MIVLLLKETILINKIAYPTDFSVDMLRRTRCYMFCGFNWKAIFRKLLTINIFYRLYDREGNGYITTGTLKEILAALDDNLTSRDLDGIIAEIDTDGSGTVDFDGMY